MTNENKNINELVSDDDITAELEALTIPREHTRTVAPMLEAEASTSGLVGRGNDGYGTVDKLQYDIEQLRARWQGLQAEMRAREEITATLNGQLDDLRESIGRKQSLIAKRSHTIKALLAEVRRRDAEQRDLDARLTAADRRNSKLQSRLLEAENAVLAIRPLAVDTAPNAPQMARTEEYADSLRRKLQDLTRNHEDLDIERCRLEADLEKANERNRQLSSDAAAAKRRLARAEEELASRQATHEQELRTLRFELGQAQETVAQSDELNSQLASDLVDARGFKDELERMLLHNDERAQLRIDELESQLAESTRAAQEFERKLDAKNQTVNVLVGELSRKTEQLASIGNPGEVTGEKDQGFTEDIEIKSQSPALERDRTTRLLVGKIGEQVLRFPLFKSQLTIGRTADNDIQLNTDCVSRRHAMIVGEDGATRIIDWGSKNGVYINSRRVTEHFLRNGDIVHIGNARFRYEERPKRET